MLSDNRYIDKQQIKMDCKECDIVCDGKVIGKIEHVENGLKITWDKELCKEHECCK